MERRGRKEVKTRRQEWAAEGSSTQGNAESWGPGMNSSHTHVAFSKAEISVCFFIPPETSVLRGFCFMRVFVWVWVFALSAKQEFSHSLSTNTHSLQNKWGVIRGELRAREAFLSFPGVGFQVFCVLARDDLNHMNHSQLSR